MTQAEFSFLELDRRIEALPDGPVAIMNAPRWMRYWNLLGFFGLIAGLLPSLLMLVWPPEMWMVSLARAGVILELVGFTPYFCRSVWQIVKSFRNWRVDQAAQLDHDVRLWDELAAWVAGHRPDVVAAHLRFAQMARTRLKAKMGLLIGSIDKLGVFPLTVAIAVHAKIAADIAEVPPWQLFLGALAAVTYMIGMMASLMYLRLQLYEMILTEALHDSPEDAPGLAS